MSVGFMVWVRVRDLPPAAVWEVTRLASEAVAKRFGPQVRGTWLILPSGRTKSSTTFQRKTVEKLRQAFEEDHVVPTSVHVWIYKTIGWARISQVSVDASWIDASVLISVHSDDKVAAERFAAKVKADVESVSTFKDVAGGMTFEIEDTRAHATDRGRGADARGGGRVVGWAVAVMGAILATVIGGLILGWIQSRT